MYIINNIIHAHVQSNIIHTFRKISLGSLDISRNLSILTTQRPDKMPFYSLRAYCKRMHVPTIFTSRNVHNVFHAEKLVLGIHVRKMSINYDLQTL